MANKKLLLFTYYWPPAGGPGVQRFLKFCKYLGEHGWDPIVVTVEKGSYPYFDHSLESEIPESVQVHKTKTFEPFTWYNMLHGKKGKSVPVAMIGIRDSKSPFQKLSKYVRANYFIPDARVGWKKYALKKAMEIIKEHDIDAIVTTSPPHSTHLIGQELKKRTGLPWLADFRDPWTQIYYNQFLPRTKKTIALDEKMETEVLRDADAVTTVSDSIRAEFADRSDNIKVIYNGYDQSDMPSITSRRVQKFKLSYIGNLKPNQDVSNVWNAAAELIKENEAFAEHFVLSLTGKADPNIISEMKSVGLGKNLEINGFVDHKEAVRLMVAANLLLFIIPKGDTAKSILTGKIFEYLASMRPLLSIGPPDGDASKVLQECGRNEMIDYDDQAKVKEQLLAHFNTWMERDKMQYLHEGDTHKQFERSETTRQLAETLNQISDGNK